MILMAGLGIDTMRQEMERARLQAALDSAVLAGAGAPAGTEVEDIKGIVEDYFAKMNMAGYLNEIDTDSDITTSLTATRVQATASRTIKTHLMKLSGVETLSAGGASAAEVRTPKLEVSLVLDVSGSMRGSKLSNLQTAAKTFVSTVLDDSDPGNTVISLVPFAWNVTPGPDIADLITVNKTHDYSSCLRFDTADYNTTRIDPGTAYDQQIYTAIYYNGFDDFNDGWRSCFPEERAQILPYSMDEANLHNRIDALDADGNTSAHIGLKWGAAMLDPEFQTIFESLKSSGVVDASLENYPAAYDEPESLKIIVLMADGQNTPSYYFDESSPYRGPNSDLYFLEYQEMEFQYLYPVYNVNKRYHEDWAEQYCSNSNYECVYEPTGDVVSAHFLRDGSRYYNTKEEEWLDGSEMEAIRSSDGFVSEERLDWEEAWGLISPRYYGDVTGKWGPWNDYVGSERVNGSAKDSRMQAICSATRGQGVVVYTIGYGISSGGNAETQLQTCASSPNHYYPTDGSNISSAFSSIASNVKNLRLTQ